MEHMFFNQIEHKSVISLKVFAIPCFICSGSFPLLAKCCTKMVTLSILYGGMMFKNSAFRLLSQSIFLIFMLSAPFTTRNCPS